MVTHNPDLAKEYSSRIISMVDGRITNDTNPCWGGSDFDAPVQKAKKKKKRSLRGLFSITPTDVEKYGLSGTGVYSSRMAKRKKSMSFWTALSLSFNNLLTKNSRLLLKKMISIYGKTIAYNILSIANLAFNF